MIRAIPSNASDNVYCTLLAHSVVHGAMAGYTGFTIGQVNSRHCYIPFYVSRPLVGHWIMFYCVQHNKLNKVFCSNVPRPDFLYHSRG